MERDFSATITNPARAAEWQAVFGTTTVNIKSPLPEWADLPGKGRSIVYFLDLDLITLEQRQRLVEHISQKFNLSAAEVEADLDAHGMPILDEDCLVTAVNPQKWLDSIELSDDEDIYFDDEDEEEDDYDPYYDDYGENEEL